MGRIDPIIPDELENQVRKRCLRKGDLSKFVTEALRLKLKETSG